MHQTIGSIILDDWGDGFEYVATLVVDQPQGIQFLFIFPLLYM